MERRNGTWAYHTVQRVTVESMRRTRCTDVLMHLSTTTDFIHWSSLWLCTRNFFKVWLLHLQKGIVRDFIMLSHYFSIYVTQLSWSSGANCRMGKRASWWPVNEPIWLEDIETALFNQPYLACFTLKTNRRRKMPFCVHTRTSPAVTKYILSSIALKQSLTIRFWQAGPKT